MCAVLKSFMPEGREVEEKLSAFASLGKLIREIPRARAAAGTSSLSREDLPRTVSFSLVNSCILSR